LKKKIKSEQITKNLEEIQKLEKDLENKQEQITNLKEKLEETETKMTEIIENQKIYETNMKEEIKRLLIDLTKKERKEEKETVRENNIKYGGIEEQKTAGSLIVSEVFKKGDLFEEYENKKNNIMKKKENFEKLKKSEKKKKGNIKKEGNEEITRHNFEQEEIYKLQLAILKKEEVDLEAELQELEIKKSEHILMSKRVNYLNKSNHNNFQLYGDRYLLLNILGKGKIIINKKRWFFRSL
jgi:tousled-like kinase